MKVLCRYDELVPVSSLKPFPQNRNLHSEEQIERLAKLLSHHGVRAPIIVAKPPYSCIAKGHGTLEAIKRNGWTEAPVVYQDFDSPEDLYTFVQSDNAIASWAELDLSGIHLDLPTLQPFDLDLLGIKDFKFEPDTDRGCDDDDVPEVPKEAKTKPGELWILGNHRLLVGDCTVKENIERLMAGEKAQLWSSDPPYGINHVDTSQQKNQSQGYARIQNDDLQFDQLKDFLEKSIRNCIEFGLSDNFAFYMWHAMKMQSYAAAAAAAAGILFHRQIIWVKPSLVFGRGHYHWRHELCLMGWLTGSEPPFYGERNQTTVWELGRENDKLHPTQKPVAITEIPIMNHTKLGETVLDPFLGSGSTLIACEKTNRRCFGCEIDPLYCDVILDRWAKYSGKDPVREDGVTWSEVSASVAVASEV